MSVNREPLSACTGGMDCCESAVVRLNTQLGSTTFRCAPPHWVAGCTEGNLGRLNLAFSTAFKCGAVPLYGDGPASSFALEGGCDSAPRLEWRLPTPGGAATEDFEGGPHPTGSHANHPPFGWGSHGTTASIKVIRSGSLVSDVDLRSPAPGNYFVGLQGADCWIQRDLAGTSPGHEYAVSFLAAYWSRGGPGNTYEPAVLRLLVDGAEISGAVALEPRFTRHEYKFVAAARSATIRFSSRGTANGDRTAFLDAVVIKATGRHGGGGTVHMCCVQTSVCPSVCLSVHLSACLPVCLSVSVCLSASLPLSVSLSLSLSVSLSLFVCLYLSLCISVCLSLPRALSLFLLSCLSIIRGTTLASGAEAQGQLGATTKFGQRMSRLHAQTQSPLACELDPASTDTQPCAAFLSVHAYFAALPHAGACPRLLPYAYGNSEVGVFCCRTKPSESRPGFCSANASLEACCLSPGTASGCQGVIKRCYESGGQ